MRADFFPEYPMTLKGRMYALKYVTPCIGMAQVFYPADPQVENHVQLISPDQLVLRHGKLPKNGIERQLARLFRKTGFFTVSSLARTPIAGSSIHYAGMCPMRRVPSAPWECDRYGKLKGWRHVFVADGACFPRLPAKNLSLTIMANAMRVAERVEDGLK
jgi:choline dehydrogenase-like flavoprotein